MARIPVPFRVVRVTGTNGKTTTTTMIEAIAARAGDASGRVTTVGSWVRGEQVAGEPTLEGLRRTFDHAAAASVKTMVLETTSYALSKGVAEEMPATVGVFTNLSRDHLDYHGTPEVYLAAKAQLFMTLLPGGTAVLNAADPSSALLAEVIPPGVRLVAYAGRSIDPGCASLPIALAASSVAVDRHGTRVRLAPSPLADWLGGEITLRLIGHVHAENALAAALAADAFGYPAEAIREALAALPGVPGRFQVVDREGGPLVVVDYAHTPDALERTLSLARALVSPAKGRVICVFGCGGDRDRGKRPEMGRVAVRAADVVFVTTDNPRGERPEAIAEQILSGVEGRFARPIRITDRGRAIRKAIEVARDPDIVVIAGKGHEKTQVFRDHVVPFDDVEVARSAPSAADGETGRKSRK
ncbi:MAG: UDP-N-acetylmuramoyl-L-alanyl-D-glutamate--2,6-diaminopimelate ligase [Minicystis sp.]